MPAVLQVEGEDARLARQCNAWPARLRRSSAVALFSGGHAPALTMSFAGGCAAAGIAYGSDDHGPVGNGHWVYDYPEMYRRLNSGHGSGYHYLDALAADTEVEGIVRDYPNTHVIVSINHLRESRHTLPFFLKAAGTLITLVLTGPGGFLVGRDESGTVVEWLDLCIAELGEAIPAGSPELGVAAAGVVLNEVMRGRAAGDRGIIAFYSLHHSTRVHAGTRSFVDLAAEVAAPVERASLSGCRFEMVGAGALANWVMLALTLEHPALVRVWDGGSIEIHNLNRQILLVDGLGRGGISKAEVLCQQGAKIDGHGRYQAVPRYVREPADLTELWSSLPDALICVPDNDEARLVCADAARASGAVYGTAGSSVLGAQCVIAQPGRACGRCQINSDAAGARQSHPCGLQGDAVVTTNMVGAGLLLSEIREVLSGRRSRNLRFVGDAAVGNRLARAISDPPCVHLNASEGGERGDGGHDRVPGSE